MASTLPSISAANSESPVDASDVEVVIPSFKRIPTITAAFRWLRHLYPQLRVCLGLQVQRADPALAALLQGDSNARVMYLPEPSTTRTLNDCIRTSTADIILILDDDATPCPGWLEAHLAVFRSTPDLAYTCGREVRSSRGRHALSDWIRIGIETVARLFIGRQKTVNGRIIGWIGRLGLMFGNFDQPGSAIINSPRACNLGVRRRAFLLAGGFNEGFRGNAWGFEAEFGVRMARTGQLGRYVGSAIVVHHESPSGGSRGWSRQEWLSDFVQNHRLLTATLGVQAWLGAVPRLLRSFLRAQSTPRGLA